MSEHFSLNHRKICVEQKWPVCIICEKPKWFYTKNECLKHYQTKHSEISSTKTNKQTLWFYYAKRHIGMELFERYNSEVTRWLWNLFYFWLFSLLNFCHIRKVESNFPSNILVISNATNVMLSNFLMMIWIYIIFTITEIDWPRWNHFLSILRLPMMKNLANVFCVWRKIFRIFVGIYPISMRISVMWISITAVNSVMSPEKKCISNFSRIWNLTRIGKW